MSKLSVTATASIIVTLITKLSYLGIFLWMSLESMNIPIPSELIMPFGGYLVYQGKMNLHLLAFAGACGCLVGSLISYYLGYYGGRPLLEKYGKYILLTKHDLDIGDKLFAKYGDKVVFFSRLLPIVRTFISFPAGIAKTNIKKFIVYSFIGSLIWCYILGFIGYKIGAHQDILGAYFHKFDVVIGIIIVFAVVFYLYTHIKKLMLTQEKN